MKACTKTFVVPPGTATLSVTGIVDSTGTPFIGKIFLFHGNTTLNTLETPFRQSYGVDDGSTYQRSQGMEDSVGFGIKLTNTGGGAAWSITSTHSQLFFGGALFRAARISAVYAGGFDLTFSFNLLSGDSIIVTALGGDDLEVLAGWMNNGPPAPVFITGFPPEAVIFNAAISGAPTFVGPQAFQGLGWDTKHSGRGSTEIKVTDDGTGTNIRYITPDVALSQDFFGPGLILQRVVDWGAASFTMGGTGGANQAYTYTALGGISAAAGSLIQPGAPGLQEIVCGIAPRVVFFLSVGATAPNTLDVGVGAWSYGAADGTRQASYWTGESADHSPLTGARYLGDADVIRMATPNGGSTTFPARAAMAGFSSSRGSFTLDWLAADGTPRIVLWLALGDPTVPTLPGCAVPLPGPQDTTPDGCTAPLPSPTVF